MESIGTASGAHPNLNLTPEEKRVYGSLLKEADPDGFGAVTGDVAVKFFERTRLPPDVLGQIWQIADTENQGFLTPAGFGVVLRLIGHAQAGRQPSVAIAPSPAPLPKFDTIPGQATQSSQQPPQQPPLATQPIAQQTTGTPSSPSSGPGPIRVPALGADKVLEYSGLFEKSGAENGQLNGLVAKQIFERARLPIEVLGRIWNLADTQGRGSLDVTEFIIAMHLLASYKSGAMRGVPTTLPPGLLDAASRRAPSRLSGGALPSRPISSAGPPQMQPQFTGIQNQTRPQSPMVNRQLGTATPLSAQSSGDPWMINAADKARFDSIFATIDTTGQGFISGEQAVQFFGNARMPEEVLAQVWDLADINSDGVLNREEFAVAMYLIRQQRGSKDGRVPQSLPTGLIPPSMRKQVQPSAPQTMPVFDDAPVTKPRSAADDLFGLGFSDEPAQQPPLAPQQVAQSTGGTDVGPFANPRPPPASATSPPPSNVFKPFVPSSSFGQGLMPQATGTSIQGQTREENLLDEEDDAAPTKINNDAAELGNLSNQVGNLSKQMQDVSGQRAQAQKELSQTSQQKENFQQRLIQLRSVYDQEIKTVKGLKDQLVTSQAETKRLQQDMAMIEGTHADLQTQHQQLASALATDQQENVSLKERIRQTNTENEQLKPQLEKLKSDARQQKGLVAINRKQLATNETERDRIKAEIAAAHQEIENAKRETEESARQLEQSQRELQEAKETPMPAPLARELSPPPPIATPITQVASPAPSIGSSNPFFRRQDSGAVFSPPVGSAIQSPAPQHELDRNSVFDSIFGPSFDSAPGPAPTTSFAHEPPEAGEPARPETPKVVEPPAPPQSAQIQSSALPMRAPMLREHSINSSMHANPGESRLSPAQTPRALTPDTSTASPSSHKADDPFNTSVVDEQQESVRQSLPRGETMEKIGKVESLPGAFPASRSDSPAPSSINPAAIPAVAAAATVAAGAGIATAIVNQDEKKPIPPEQGDDFEDFFGQPSHKKTLSEQRADFDSAFVSMDTNKQPINAQSASSNQEFPDIHELEDDESSDDDSEPRGFDDHFGEPTQSSTAAGKQPELAPTLAPPPLATNVSLSTLPGFESQQSPPGYKEVVPEENATHFPMEYKNLLPAREDPTSPPLPTAGGSNEPGPNPAGAPPAYGPETTSRSQNQAEVMEAPPTKAAPFDFDSAFANMGEAPVADDSDSDYDEHTPSVAKPSQHSDFDPSFDSPAPSTRTTDTIATSVRGFSAHDAVTSPTTNGTTIASPIGSAGAGFSDFNQFSSNPFPPSRQHTLQPNDTTSPSIGNTSTSSHDWDSLFAPLNAQPQAASQSVESTDIDRPIYGADHSTGAPLSRIDTARSQHQATEIGDGLTATTTAEPIPIDNTPPASQTHVPMAMPTTNIVPSSPTTTTAPPLTQYHPSGQKLQRPAPGRALSTGTEHDDPILKRLTAMGWSRDESLVALEKFDYNIDKAADYLTFRS